MLAMSKWVGLAAVFTIVSLSACGGDANKEKPRSNGATLRQDGECPITISRPDEKFKIEPKALFNGTPGVFEFVSAQINLDHETPTHKHRLVSWSITPNQNSYAAKIECLDMHEQSDIPLTQEGEFPQKIDRGERRFINSILGKINIPAVSERSEPDAIATLELKSGSIENYLDNAPNSKDTFYVRNAGEFEMIEAFDSTDFENGGTEHVFLSIQYKLMP